MKRQKRLGEYLFRADHVLGQCAWIHASADRRSLQPRTTLSQSPTHTLTHTIHTCVPTDELRKATSTVLAARGAPVVGFACFFALFGVRTSCTPTHPDYLSFKIKKAFVCQNLLGLSYILGLKFGQHQNR